MIQPPRHCFPILAAAELARQQMPVLSSAAEIITPFSAFEITRISPSYEDTPLQAMASQAERRELRFAAASHSCRADTPSAAAPCRACAPVAGVS